MKLEEICYLALGELGFGTKAYDEMAMEGLALFLKVNGYAKRVKGVVLDSGLMPLIPEYYGLSNAKNMRFLGNDSNKKPNSNAERALEAKLDDKDREYIEKFVLHKIVSRSEAADFAKSQLEKLLSVLGDVPVHYVHGEEDRKNIEALEELKINDYMRLQENKSELEQTIEKSRFYLEESAQELECLRQERRLLSYARRYLSPHTDDFQSYVKKLLQKKSDEFMHLSKPESNALKQFLKGAKSLEDINEKLNGVKEQLSEVESEIKGTEARLRDYKINLNAIERELEASEFFRITKRVHIRPDEEELLFRLAKKEYNNLLYTIAPNADFHVHTDNIVNIEINGYKFVLMHSTNLGGDSTSSTSLAKMKKENNTLNKNGNEVPDVRISAHGSGGFRFQHQPKYTENTIEGEERETPESCLNMKLPSFQSPENLEYLKQKGIKNWHTKRYDAKNYAAGAVIHTIRQDGVQEVEYIDIKELIRFGEIAREIKERKLHRKGAKDLEDMVRLSLEKIEIQGDAHIGCPNVKGRPSNYDFIDAAQSYQEEHGLPALVVTSEMLHGTLEKIFSSNKQYFSVTPAEREMIEKAISNDAALSDADKVMKLKEMYKAEHEAIPITSNSVAKMEMKRRVIPYFEKILDNGGQVVLVSGNHYNCSTGEDEAYEIASMLPTKYIDSGQVKIFHGLGAKFGSGTIRLGEKKLYSAHKPHNGVDEVAGAMNQIMGAGIDASIVVFFDRHHPGGGYAENSAFVAAAGMQPWNKYVDAIGKYPGMRGIVNLWHDPRMRYYKWENVFDKALEGRMRK